MRSPDVLRRQLGDDTFFDLLRTWTSTHRHGSVTTDDFLALATSAAPDADAVRTLLAARLDSAELPPLPRTPRRR